MYFVNAFVQLCVLPIIDLMYPVMSIELKYITICGSRERSDTSSAIDLEDWESYVQYINRRVELDYFDLLIEQKIRQINRKIKLTVSKSQNTSIDYKTFYTILQTEIGSDPIDVKYRFVRPSRSSLDNLFVSVFDDDGPYRKFRWCDRI